MKDEDNMAEKKNEMWRKELWRETGRRGGESFQNFGNWGHLKGHQMRGIRWAYMRPEPETKKGIRVRWQDCAG
jgi:hypothetical protein